MAGSKLLLDTNIFIALEDPTIVPPAVARLAQKASLHGLSIFLDEACIEDVHRDTNLERRAATLSKLQKFTVLEHIAHRPPDIQMSRFGQISGDNDRCDLLMLDTLDLGIVDFLITEDTGIHRRAERASLRNRVFTDREALGWMQRTYEPKDFRLRYIVARKAHQISVDDPIFVSLRADYEHFDEWFAKCRCVHRDCWIVEIENHLAGLVIRKDEPHAEAQTDHPGPRILKICTLKMKPEYQGERFGEQLLKKILWFAQGNLYDLIYLTVFPRQELLISLLSRFGFQVTKKQPNGELVMERPMLTGALPSVADRESALVLDFRAYPRFYDGHRVRKYVIPIRPEFHIILFPEIAEAPELPLFPSEPYLVTARSAIDRTPGNTIRKVYICRSPTRTLAAGDILLLYLSKSPDLIRSQCLTTVGIVEEAQLAESTDELVRLVGRRSVYARESIDSMRASKDSPVLVIDFLLSGHLKPPLSLEVLLKSGAFISNPPQSIKNLNESTFDGLRPAICVDFS
jgi:ribosomal protein S18 acetylase RimI-like enzyme